MHRMTPEERLEWEELKNSILTDLEKGNSQNPYFDRDWARYQELSKYAQEQGNREKVGCMVGAAVLTGIAAGSYVACHGNDAVAQTPHVRGTDGAEHVPDVIDPNNPVVDEKKLWRQRTETSTEPAEKQR